MCLPVLTAVNQSKRSSPYCDGMCACSVTRDVIQNSDVPNFLSPNNQPTKEFGSKESQDGFIPHDIGSLTLNESPISKQDDTHENEMRKVHTRWKSGRLSKRDLLIGVPTAERERRLRKTISNLYPSVEPTTL